MAAGDAKPPRADDDESPEPPKPDVRVGSHDDMGVHISRDLRGQGPTARGWNSNMSQLSFSSRGRPRDEITAPEPEQSRPAPAPVVPPAPPVAEAPVAPPASPDGGVVSWLTGLFSRR